MIQNRAMSFFEILSAPVTIGKIMPLATRRDDMGIRFRPTKATAAQAAASAIEIVRLATNSSISSLQ